MILSITEDNYKKSLDRFTDLWDTIKDAQKDHIEELEVLADLLSAFEERKFPLFNNPTYRDLLNEKLKKI